MTDKLTDRTLAAVLRRMRLDIDLTRRELIRWRGGAGTPGGGGGTAGDVKVTAAVTIPDGWLECNGQSLERAAYPVLFAAIGTTYGAVDGTHFNVPDARGRVIVGLDAAQTEFDTLGKVGGSKTHTLTTAQLPSHSHNVNALGYNGGTGTTRFQVGFGDTRNTTNDVVTDAAGGGAPHNNLQPFITLRTIIKAT